LFPLEYLPENWWTIANQRRYLEWFRTSILKGELDEFYHVTTNSIRRHKGTSSLATLTQHISKAFTGSGLVAMYSNSISAAIMAVYPEHEWLPWKFQTVSRQWWAEKKNQLNFLEWLRTSVFQFSESSKWYHLSVQDIELHGGKGLVNIYGKSMYTILSNAYPTYEWIPSKFLPHPKQTPRTAQSFLTLHRA